MTRFFVAGPPQNDIWWEMGKRGLVSFNRLRMSGIVVVFSGLGGEEGEEGGFQTRPYRESQAICVGE